MFKTVISMLILCTTLLAANSDYLIVKNPAALHILDTYEQRLSKEAKEQLPSHIPFQILAENHLLSDMYTNAIKVTSDGFVYYLVKNKKGKLFTEIPGNRPVRITNAHMLSDTIEIIQSNKVSFDQIDRKRTLEANILMQLIFAKNNRYYVKHLSPGGAHGWLDRNQSRYWKPFKREQLAATGSMEFPVYLVNTIQAQFDNYNRILQQLFQFFNRTEKTSKQIPNWVLVVKSNRIICRLENNPNGSNYEKSSQLIIRRIEKILSAGMG